MMKTTGKKGSNSLLPFFWTRLGGFRDIALVLAIYAGLFGIVVLIEIVFVLEGPQ